ncbi:MAG: DUF1559 family PulG-like putative transporter [Gemmataceae bacterium]
MAMQALTRWHGGGVAALLLGALLLALLTTENPLPADAEAKAPALPPDLAKIPSDGLLLISGRLSDLWNSDLTKPVRQKLAKEMNEAAGEFEKKFGLPLDQVERLSMALTNIGSEEPLFFVGTTKAYDRDKVIAAGAKGKEEKYKGQTLYVKGKNWAVYPLGERALVYGNLSAIHGLIDRPANSDGSLTAALHLAAGKHSLVCAVNVKAINDEVGERLPGEMEPFKPILQALYGTLTLDVGAETRTEVKLNFANEKSAKGALQPARTGLDLARDGLDRGLEQLSKEKEMGKFVELLKQLQGTMKSAQIEQQGKNLQASAHLKVDVANVGPALVEAVQKVRASAALSQTQNNLKQLVLAMHNYADTLGGRFPPQATYDKNGKPMLSWRVMILPYLDELNLYNEFHLNEPWDSEHNKKLLAKMPKVYASPQDPEKTLKDHLTHYQGFVGKSAFFEGKRGLLLADITDGLSNTIMIVEASKAVPWSKPEDLPYDAAKPLPKLGIAGARDFSAALCDGSVRLITPHMSERTLRLTITRDDGLPLPADF